MNRKVAINGIVAACAMLVIILDAKTAVSAARDGVQLCICTVIPSLFPFFVLSGMINSCLLGLRFGLLRPLGKLCKIPEGGESLLVLGFLAGYPVGAQLITQSCREGKLSRQTARRMLGFCSNAGPAFLFGMLSPLFTGPAVVWILWGIHIVSALITGWVLPVGDASVCRIKPGAPTTLVQSLQNAIKTMAAVCGWVVTFRVILGFFSRWFLWLFPMQVQVLFSGFVELANGCVNLQQLSQEGMRFLLASSMLAFGGLCVGMQTLSVTRGVGTGCYFPGKALQTVLSVLIGCLIQPLLFAEADAVDIPVSVLLVLIALTAIAAYCIRRKKVVAFGRTLLYNTGN